MIQFRLEATHCLPQLRRTRHESSHADHTNNHIQGLSLLMYHTLIHAINQVYTINFWRIDIGQLHLKTVYSQVI